MSAPPPFLSSAASNTGCAAPGRAASHTPPSLPTPALSPLREVPKIPVPLACSLRLRKHRTKHPAEPAMRQGWVWWIAYARGMSRQTQQHRSSSVDARKRWHEWIYLLMRDVVPDVSGRKLIGR